MASETSGSGRQSRGGSQSAASGNTEELQAQIETLKEDLAAIGATLAELVKSGAREGRSKVEQAADDYRRKGAEQADEALKEARAYGEALEEKIVQNPFAAVLVALGLGFLAGLITRR